MKRGLGKATTGVSPASNCSMARAAIWPNSTTGWCTVDSGGIAYSALAMSSKPTSDTSSGTRNLRRCRPSAAPRAIWSLAAKMAVKDSRLSIKRSSAVWPLSSVYWPGTTSAGLKAKPAACSAAR